MDFIIGCVILGVSMFLCLFLGACLWAVLDYVLDYVIDVIDIAVDNVTGTASFILVFLFIVLLYPVAFISDIPRFIFDREKRYFFKGDKMDRFESEVKR